MFFTKEKSVYNEDKRNNKIKAFIKNIPIKYFIGIPLFIVSLILLIYYYTIPYFKGYKYEAKLSNSYYSLTFINENQIEFYSSTWSGNSSKNIYYYNIEDEVIYYTNYLYGNYEVCGKFKSNSLITNGYINYVCVKGNSIKAIVLSAFIIISSYLILDYGYYLFKKRKKKEDELTRLKYEIEKLKNEKGSE